MCALEKGHPGPGSLVDLAVDYEQEVRFYRIDGVPGKLDRLAKGKARTEAFLDHIVGVAGCQQGGGRPGYCLVGGIWVPLEEVRRCGLSLALERWPGADDYQIGGHFCRRPLLCISCAIRRAGVLWSRGRDRLELARRDGRLDGLIPHMLTLTVKDGPDLAERLEHVAGTLGGLIHTRRAGRGSTSFRRLAGGTFSYEFKMGKWSRLWHPHVHAVVFADGELPLERQPPDDRGRVVYRWPELAEEWRRLTGDSFIVECHPIVDDPGNPSFSGMDDALCEVFKYQVKPNCLAPDEQLLAYRVLSGRRRRLMDSFGVLRGLGIGEFPGKELRMEHQREREAKRKGHSVDSWWYTYRACEYVLDSWNHRDADGVVAGGVAG